MTSQNGSTAPSPAEWSGYPTELGRAWAHWDDHGLTALGLPGSTPPPGPESRPPRAVALLVDDLTAYFAGEGSLPDATDVLPRAASTPFFDAVYRLVCRIPAGEVETYSALAAAAGRPGAARAVGAAMAANRYAPVIPCHRVVGSDGALRGYAGGLEMKRRLLDMERSSA